MAAHPREQPAGGFRRASALLISGIVVGLLLSQLLSVVVTPEARRYTGSVLRAAAHALEQPAADATSALPPASPAPPPPARVTRADGAAGVAVAAAAASHAATAPKRTAAAKQHVAVAAAAAAKQHVAAAEAAAGTSAAATKKKAAAKTVKAAASPSAAATVAAADAADPPVEPAAFDVAGAAASPPADEEPPPANDACPPYPSADAYYAARLHALPAVPVYEAPAGGKSLAVLFSLPTEPDAICAPAGEAAELPAAGTAPAAPFDAAPLPVHWVDLSREISPAEFPCFWTHVDVAPGERLVMCTANPAIDVGVSLSLHESHTWEPQHLDTYAAAGCSASRPYMLDIGSNLGIFALHAARLGCRVLAFEPLSPNLARAAQSVARNGLLERVRFLKHAAGAAPWRSVQLRYVELNPGASKVVAAEEPPSEGSSRVEDVVQLTIDGLLLGAQAPPPPGAGLPPVVGAHISIVKIDTEGFDAGVLAGALHTVLGGRVPYIHIELTPRMARDLLGCDVPALTAALYASGYKVYADGAAYASAAELAAMLPGMEERWTTLDAWVVLTEALTPALRRQLVAPVSVDSYFYAMLRPLVLAEPPFPPPPASAAAVTAAAAAAAVQAALAAYILPEARAPRAAARCGAPVGDAAAVRAVPRTLPPRRFAPRTSLRASPANCSWNVLRLPPSGDIALCTAPPGGAVLGADIEGAADRELAAAVAAGGAPIESRLARVLAIGAGSAPCSPARPYVLDAGAGAAAGAVTLLAARLGCRVLASEPSPRRLRRLAQAAMRNGLQDRIALYAHAAGDAWGVLPPPRGAPATPEALDDAADVLQLPLDALLLGAHAPARFLGLESKDAGAPPVVGRFVAFARFGASPADGGREALAALAGALHTIIDGSIPLILVEFAPPAADAAAPPPLLAPPRAPAGAKRAAPAPPAPQAPCALRDVLGALADAGYALHVGGAALDIAAALAEKDGDALTALLQAGEGADGREPVDAWFVHADTALTPELAALLANEAAPAPAGAAA